MARQSSVLKFEGQLDDMSFVKTKTGYRVRKKGGISASRFATDPAYARLREHNQEFGRAGKAGKIIRDALRAQTRQASDDKLVPRLTSLMLEVIKADAVSVRGQRNILDGELEMLEGFEFNSAAGLSRILPVQFSTTLDRATGQAGVSLPAYVPASLIASAQDATHYRILMAAAEIDFENGKYVVETQESAVIPLNNLPTAPLNLQASLPANSSHPLFLGLGIEFLQETNSRFYPLLNKAFNAYKLVKVSGA